MNHSRRWYVLAFFVFVTAIYIGLRLHALAIPLDRDEGVFGYTAQRILDGGKPYLDALDHKPPGAFYIYLLPVLLLPATAVGVHSFLAVYNFVTLIMVALVMHVRFPGSRAWMGGALCYALFSASPAIQGFTASTEMLMLLPVTLCLLFALAAQHRQRYWLAFLSGAFGAAAFWIKQTSASSVAFALLYLAAARWLDPQEDTSRPLEPLPKSLLAWISGAGGVSVLVIGYFYVHGLYHEFIYWSFVHNVEYASQVSLSDSAAGILEGLQKILYGDFAVIGLGVVVALLLFRKYRRDSLFVLAFLTLSFVGTLPGLFYAHYFAQLAPAVAIASGWALSVVATGKSLKSKIALGVIVVGLIGIPIYAHRDYFLLLSPDEISRKYFGENPFPEAPELSSFLESRTTPTDRIFIAGSEPEILFQAHRRSATPFVMIYPLTQQYPRYREFQEQLLHDVEGNHPTYILTTNIPMSILWDGKASMELFESFADKILPDYELEAVERIGYPKGRLILVHNGIPDSEINPDDPLISVYRRTGSH